MSRDDRRAQLIDVAARLVVERGVDAVTMEAVGEAAGASKTIGYQYFENLHELLLAVLQRELDALNDYAAPRLREAQGFDDIVRAGVGAWFDLVERRGALIVALTQAGPLQGELEVRRRDFLRNAETLYGRIIAAQFGIDDDVAMAAASILLPGIGGALTRWIQTGQPRQLFEDTFVEVVAGAVERLAR